MRAVRWVADRRISYIAGQLEKLGRDPDEALDRAVVLYHVYIGYLQMAHVAPDVINVDGRGRQLELVFNALVTGEVPPKSIRRMRQEAAVAQSRGAGTVNQSARHHGGRRPDG